MGTAVVTIVGEFAHDVIEVCQAKHDQVIEGLVLQDWNPSRC